MVKLLGAGVDCGRELHDGAAMGVADGGGCERAEGDGGEQN